MRYAMCIQVPEEARREHWTLWSWGYRWLRTTCKGPWHRNLRPQKWQPIVLTAETSCQPSWVFLAIWQTVQSFRINHCGFWSCLLLLEVFSSIPRSLSDFTMTDCVKCFVWLQRHWRNAAPCPINIIYFTDRFLDVKATCVLRIIPTWPWWTIPFTRFWSYFYGVRLECLYVLVKYPSPQR